MAVLETAQEAEVGHSEVSYSHRFQVQEDVQLLVEVTFQGTERICGVVETGGCRFFHSTDKGHICALGETELLDFDHTGLYQHP
jgi:hypothetical protein